MAKPVLINQSKPFIAEELRTLFHGSYTFADNIHVKPNARPVAIRSGTGGSCLLVPRRLNFFETQINVN